MAFGAHHRPQVPYRLDIVELRQTGLGDHLERLACGIGQKVEMKSTHARHTAGITASDPVPAAHHFGLWKTMGKSLAEACGAFQGKLSSPFFGNDPQFNEE
jgi:hypothetical protein